MRISTSATYASAIHEPREDRRGLLRHQNYVGLEVAIAALREYLARGRGPKRRNAARYSIDALVNAAKVDRVARIIRPYLEALA